mmetsp:Transcript_43851/g.137775  ORF Transcript_43851/g.137775 Transcript_43851/m.137775 type:complete len:209 (+) Transcript_43851:2338-2964(+)
MDLGGLDAAGRAGASRRCPNAATDNCPDRPPGAPQPEPKYPLRPRAAGGLARGEEPVHIPPLRGVREHGHIHRRRGGGGERRAERRAPLHHTAGEPSACNGLRSHRGALRRRSRGLPSHLHLQLRRPRAQPRLLLLEQAARCAASAGQRLERGRADVRSGRRRPARRVRQRGGRRHGDALAGRRSVREHPPAAADAGCHGSLGGLPAH